MPNRKRHQLIGTLCGVAIAAAIDLSQQQKQINAGLREKIDLGRLLGWSAVGGVVGCAAGTLPDLLEPADSPSHRKFFHSFTTLGITAVGMHKVHVSKKLNHEEKLVLKVALAGYASHLVADSDTPMSLPVI